MDEWVSLPRSKFVLSSVTISSPIVVAQHDRNSQFPGLTYVRNTRNKIHSRASDASAATIGLGQNGGHVETCLSLTLMKEQADDLCLQKKQLDNRLNKSSYDFRRTVRKMVCGSGLQCFWNDPRTSPVDGP